jgi:uncharacterized protein YbcI
VESPAREDSVAPLAGGKLLAAISTSIVGIIREHYGRGPMRAKTYARDDLIVVVIRGSGFTRARADDHEQRRAGRVVAMREDFNASWKTAPSEPSRS